MAAPSTPSAAIHLVIEHATWFTAQVAAVSALAEQVAIDVDPQAGFRVAQFDASNSMGCQFDVAPAAFQTFHVQHPKALWMDSASWNAIMGTTTTDTTLTLTLTTLDATSLQVGVRGADFHRRAFVPLLTDDGRTRYDNVAQLRPPLVVPLPTSIYSREVAACDKWKATRIQFATGLRTLVVRSETKVGSMSVQTAEADVRIEQDVRAGACTAWYSLFFAKEVVKVARLNEEMALGIAVDGAPFYAAFTHTDHPGCVTHAIIGAYQE